MIRGLGLIQLTVHESSELSISVNDVVRLTSYNYSAHSDCLAAKAAVILMVVARGSWQYPEL